MLGDYDEEYSVGLPVFQTLYYLITGLDRRCKISFPQQHAVSAQQEMPNLGLPKSARPIRLAETWERNDIYLV